MACNRRDRSRKHSGTFGDGLGISAESDKHGRGLHVSPVGDQQTEPGRASSRPAPAPPRELGVLRPQALANLTVPQEWVDTLIASGEIGLPSLPQIVPVTEFRDIFGIALTNLITGGDPQQELEAATEEFRPILEQSLAT